MRPTQAKRAYLRQENARYGPTLAEVPSALWPEDCGEPRPSRVLRSRSFLALVYESSPVRISVCRTDIGSQGGWRDGIAWEDLQRIKGECGYADSDAVEVYPSERDVVNVANMRHLWIVPPLEFAWRRRAALAAKETENGS